MNAFDTAAEITNIDDDIRMAIGVLEQYYDKHENKAAKKVADHLKKLLPSDEDV